MYHPIEKQKYGLTAVFNAAHAARVSSIVNITRNIRKLAIEKMIKQAKTKVIKYFKKGYAETKRYRV